MSILKGFKRFKKFIKTDNGYMPSYDKTIASAVCFGDGTDDTNTVESRLSGIKGITTSNSVTETGYAADASVVSEISNDITEIQDNISTLNSSLVNKQDTLLITKGSCVAWNCNIDQQYCVKYGKLCKVYVRGTTINGLANGLSIFALPWAIKDVDTMNLDAHFTYWNANAGATGDEVLNGKVIYNSNHSLISWGGETKSGMIYGFAFDFTYFCE